MSRDRTHAALPQELRSWVDNCLVPILVKEYLSKAQKTLATKAEFVAHSAGDVTSRTKVNQ